MPPSRSLYQYSCRGFICKSCVSKVLCPRRPWASRNITSDSGTPKAGPKRLAQSSPASASHPDIKFFIQKPDGTREEIDDPEMLDPLEDAMMKSKFAEIEKQLDRLQATAEKDLRLKTEGQGHAHQTSGLEDDWQEGTHQMQEFMQELTDDKSEEREVARQVSALTSEQREELLAAMRVMVERLDEEPLKPHPTYNFDLKLDGLPNEQVVRLDTFMKALKQAALGNNFTHAQKKLLWKQYSTNRHVLREMRDQPPTDLWTFLWTVFATTALQNPERLGRLKLLAEDMEHVGITLEDTQLLIYLETCFLDGQRKNALDRWRSVTGSLGEKKSAVFRQFWELGTKMLVMDALPQEALDAAIVLFKGAPDADPRIIIPIIASWLTSNDDKKLQKAWALYQRLRLALSGEMQMKDFDAIAAIFLGADQPGLALGVFRDMMSMGDQNIQQKGASTPALDDVFDKPNLEITNKGMEDIDWTDFEALARLPQKQRNKFFFGSWIKKLLGEKQMTAALQVLQLMRQYKVRPYAIQLNGVVGALLRSKTVKGHAMGEQIAWEMIQARKEFLDSRQRLPVLQSPARLAMSFGKDNFVRAVGDLRYTPPATAETLALLVENYRRRDLHPHVQDLWHMFGTLRLRPTTYTLNQFLLSYHRAHDPSSAMEILNTCVNIHHVKPDLDTIKWLWELLKTRRALTQVAVRRLFAFTVNHVPPSITTPEEKILIAEIYNSAILCLGLADDQLGTAIAIRTFQERFGVYPQEETLKNTINRLASSTKPTLSKPTSRPRPSRPPNSRRRYTLIRSTFDKVRQKRAEELIAQGTNLALMDERTKGEENINMLIELLKSRYESRTEKMAILWDEDKTKKGQVANQSVDQKQTAIELKNIKDVAKLMGVPGIKPWDIKSWND